MKRKLTFESSIKKIESIIDKLESGDESLENSLKLFQEGTELAANCYKILEDAEQKIIDLSELESDINDMKEE